MDFETLEKANEIAHRIYGLDALLASKGNKMGFGCSGVQPVDSEILEKVVRKRAKKELKKLNAELKSL